MPVIRSSVLTDNEGFTLPRRLWVLALNQRAPIVLADLADTVLPYYRDYSKARLEASGKDELIAAMIVTGPALHWWSKMMTWMISHNLSTNDEPGDWWDQCIEHTLEYWLTRDCRKLVPPPGKDSIVERTKTFAWLMKAVVPTLRSAIGPALRHASGDISKEELAELCGQAYKAAVREELEKHERRLEAMPAPTRPGSGLRLSFEPADAEAAVRYQVLGETFEQIAENDRRDPSNLRKVVLEFLKSVGITPRPSHRGDR